MKTVAIYNMKGGVGKTTTAVNLSYLAAASGKRVLLWDLDPQAASSFALRVRPRVAGFGRKCLGEGREFGGAIKETDYNNLDLLPADFGYRKFDRLLGRLAKPNRVVTDLVDVIGRDYDTVFLDCPAGFSLLIEGVFATVDAVLVPTIPTVLSLRTVTRLIKWADRSNSPSQMTAFFNMVDRRKTLHRRACEWSEGQTGVFLAGQVPYASIVEQMAVRRMPLGAFAPRDAAAMAFVEIWSEVQTSLQEHEASRRQRDQWLHTLRAIESLITQLESPNGRDSEGARQLAAANEGGGVSAPDRGSLGEDDPCIVHCFDTEGRDLQRCDHVLELRERNGDLLLVAGQAGSAHGAERAARAEARVDKFWAVQILAGSLSPLAALEQRLGHPACGAVENVRAIVGGRRLRRVDSHMLRDSRTKAHKVAARLTRTAPLHSLLAPNQITDGCT